MQDRPAAVDLVKSVAKLLQDTVLPQSTGRTAFEVRVAINALELVARQLTHGEDFDAAEMHRLEALLGQAGTLFALNRDLAARIAEGTVEAADPALIDHLWRTTMEKLAIDQPAYAAYRDELQRTTKG